MIPLAIIVLISFPWIVISGSIWICEPNPAEPAIKYAEFPFEVIYEIDGEIFTVKDIYICKYDGIGMNAGVGKYRDWKGYIKSTGKEELFLKAENDVEFFLNVGNPEYYMDEQDEEDTKTFAPYIGTVTALENGYSLSTISFDLASYHHGIDIISIELSDPIENSFK